MESSLLKTRYDKLYFADIKNRDGMLIWSVHQNDMPPEPGCVGEVRWHNYWGKAYFFPERYHGLGDNVLHEICEFMAQLQQVLREEKGS